MKFSSKILKCQLSPVRKFNPCADQAVAAGRTIYHLNIGQPDVKTPESFYQAVREFREPTLEYAPASGLPAYIDAVRGYYAKLGVKLEREDILATSGGGEALEFIMACILDDGDELLVPEPFYANYNTFTFMSGGVIHPIPTSADNGYRFADRKLIESQINERTRAILVTNPGNPTGLVLTHEEMRVIADVVKEHDLFLVADEVSEISERAVEVLFSRLRWRTHETFKTPRMLLTTNPTINWVRSRFVQGENGEKVICREGEAYIPFSVFDNPNIAFRQVYEAALNKIRDQATKERLLYGNWDFVEANDMAIYSSFDGARHLVTGLKERAYDPTRPLITVWDFNVAPQMSVLSAQIDYENKKVYILEEILGRPEEKENNTPALARKVRLKLYRDKHIGGVDVTGDPSGLQRSTTNEDGVNNYTIIVGTFGKGVLRPKVKLLRKQPPQVTRCEFVNEVFDGYNGWEVQIDVKCRNLTRDLIYQLRNEDGTKSKQKTTDPKTGVKYERYGHLSDCLDYLLCYYLRDSWYKFKSGDANGYIVSTSVIQEGFSY